MANSGMSLLEQLGLEEKDLRWQQLAACKDMPINWFFDDYESDPEHAKAMDEICLRCPVLKNCLAEGVEDKDYGLRGGIYMNNGKMEPGRNEHKTAEVWKRFEERVRE